MSSTPDIHSVKQLIDLWPTRKVLADDVSTTKDRVDKWAQTGSIPAKFHGAIVRAAQARCFSVTADDMVRVHDPAFGRVA